jgi:L-ornithine N5-oxygenase
VIPSDLVVYATGYRSADPLALLGADAAHWERDADGRPGFHRDYRVVTPPEVTAGLYAPGATEHTHGLTSTLLSNVAVRAGEMLASIVASIPGRSGPQPAEQTPPTRALPPPTPPPSPAVRQPVDAAARESAP